MTEMYRITSNPNINCFYFKGRYLYPYGNSPAIDLTGGCEIKKDVDFLLLACGDIRNILFTLKTLVELKIKPKTLNFHVNDIEDVILARNLVLLAILDKIDPQESEDMDFLWSVWYDMAISRESLERVRHIIEELLQHGNPRVKAMTHKCDEEIKYVFKYWLEREFSLKGIMHRRNGEFEERLVKAKEMEKSIISYALYGEVQQQNWRQEVGYFVETGSTYRGEHVQRLDDLVANPTLICPCVGGAWRIHYSGTPFHSYNLLRLTEGQSLFENCLSQLKRLVQAWKKCNATKSICLKVSLWLDDCLTLCNHTLPSNVKFDFIHTSNIQDHVGVLNLLASCSGRLKISGVLTTESLLWAEVFSSIEDYLNATIGIPPSYFPTVLGLRLAEDFTMGTSEPRSLFQHVGSEKVTFLWLKAEKAAEQISIYESPDLLNIFRGLVQSCTLFHLPPSFACIKMPSSLVHLVRTMKDNIVGGAKALLDIMIDAQPRLQTTCGEVFYPHENCLRATWLAYRDELGCDWPKDQKEKDLLLFEIQAQPAQNTAVGIGFLHMGIICMNLMDCLTWAKSVISPREPWYFITSIAYDMTGKITFLLPSNVWNSLENSASLSISTISDEIFPVFASTSIKNDSRVQIIDRMPISSKPIPVRAVGKSLRVKEYENRYEIHMKLQESLQQSPNFKVELGSDSTEVLIKSEKFVSAYRFQCPLLDVHTELSLPDNTLQITAGKNLGVLTGPLIMKYRRLDIEKYPIESKPTQQFVRILVSNKIYQERALFIVVSERNPGQAFGHDSDDIFIYFNKCHIIDDKVTLNLVWIDFQRVNQYIKEGKITRMQVDTYYFMLGLLSGDQLVVTKVEALLLRKWLILNTGKSKQLHKDHKYQWRFNSFLQPLYSISGIVGERLLKNDAGSIDMQSNGSNSAAFEKPEKAENVCSGCSKKGSDMKRCARCQSAFYCGRECQTRDWPNHKQTCKAK